MFFCGFVVYEALSTVSVLSTVDGVRHTPGLEKQPEHKCRMQGNVLLRTGPYCKCMVYLEYFQRFTLLSNTKPQDSFEKNSNSTVQYTGVAGFLLPLSINLFVLLCNFIESELTL